MNPITAGALLIAETIIKSLPVGSQPNRYDPKTCANSKAKERRLKQAKKLEKPNDGE